ncbi:MAG TPA: DUF2851 family protein [Puia sp.]|nr:DUF2851 family protein [Puia sp.]
MTEKMLQFIWKNRYFNQQGLELTTGEPLMIDYPGELNVHQGPDFINARIRINGHFWIGSVELHLYSSGWAKHNHTKDENYRNVMLHVVWKQDKLDIKRNIPQLELCNRIPRHMLETYAGWMLKPVFIPCELSAPKTGTEKWEAWASRLLILRLNRKMHRILDSLRVNKYHWEEQLWWMIAANIGNPVNTNAFEAIARSIPFSILSKHRQQFIQLEALFMGQANLLEKSWRDPYPVMLRREFIFLKKKYGLKKIFEPVHFLRMRPENFPSIRLSQLASLCTETTALFAWTLECSSIQSMRKKLMVSANDYWHNHYVFEKISPYREKMLGIDMCNNIIINSIIPLLYTYGKMIPDQAIMKKSVSWLEQMPAEKNQLMSGWKRIGISVKKASGSQALIELKKQFCDQRKCLECEIGKHLLLPSDIHS